MVYRPGICRRRAHAARLWPVPRQLERRLRGLRQCRLHQRRAGHRRRYSGDPHLFSPSGPDRSGTDSAGRPVCGRPGLHRRCQPGARRGSRRHQFCRWPRLAKRRQQLLAGGAGRRHGKLWPDNRAANPLDLYKDRPLFRPRFIRTHVSGFRPDIGQRQQLPPARHHPRRRPQPVHPRHPRLVSRRRRLAETTRPAPNEPQVPAHKITLR